jgi:hypothetical protein
MVGLTPEGRMVYVDRSDAKSSSIDTDGNWWGAIHLPGCTGWDWVEPKRPQRGEWWFSDNMDMRCKIHGLTERGYVIFETINDNIYAAKVLNPTWHHEPLCTGWDWQP